MRVMYEWMGIETLAKELERKSETDYRKVEAKNLLEMRNRAVTSKSPSNGGTPVDTSELRQSASVNLNNGVFGYTKDYAPHVEFGHRTADGGYVPGQYYLQANVNIQQPIFRQDLIQKMKE